MQKKNKFTNFVNLPYLSYNPGIMGLVVFGRNLVAPIFTKAMYGYAMYHYL